MEHGIDFIQDLATVLIVGGFTTLLFHKLRQPVVLGYMLAGLLIGPHTPPILLIHDENNIKTLAELGIVFLMFRMGLHFSLRKLAKVGMTAFIAATFEIVAMLGVGYAIGQFFGWSRMDSVFLGAILSISSTTIIVKALMDLKMIDQRFAELIFGILIVEDILAVGLLALLSSFAMTGALEFTNVVTVSLRLLAFLATVLVIGLLLVPKILSHVAKYREPEMLLVTSLGLCFGVSLLAVEFGYSIALGAFLIGAIIAETREAGLVERVIAPVRDMFSAVFFVAVGMLIDPLILLEFATPIAVITLAVILGKVLTCASGAFLAGNDGRTSMRVGMGLAQIGEFSFIIAQLGASLAVTSKFLYPVAVMVSVLTTITTPYLIRSSDTLVSLLERIVPPPARRLGIIYQNWLQRLRASNGDEAISRSLRRASLWLTLYCLLVAAVFFSASRTALRLERDYEVIVLTLGGVRPAVWFIAAVLALPLIVGAVVKIRTIARLLGARTAAGGSRASYRNRSQLVVTRSLFVFGCLLFAAWVLLLGGALLPGSSALLYLLGVLALIAFVARKQFSALYHAIEGSLTETLTTDQRSSEAQLTDLPTMMSEVALNHFDVKSEHGAVGRLIRELHLRKRAGVLVVVMVRSGERIVNPGPDEEIRVGDSLLLVGDRAGLSRAQILLAENVDEES